MIIDIPQTNKWVQINKGDFAGSIWSSRNINLTRNEGTVKPSEKLIVTTVDTEDTTFVPATGCVVTHGSTEEALLTALWVETDGLNVPTLQASWTATAQAGTGITGVSKEITIPAGTNQSLIVFVMKGDTVTGNDSSYDTATFDGVAMNSASGNSASSSDVDLGISTAYTHVNTTAGLPTGTYTVAVEEYLGADITGEVVLQIFLFENTDTSLNPVSDDFSVNTVPESDASTTIDIEDDVAWTTTGHDDDVLLAGCVSTPATHTYSGGIVTDIVGDTNFVSLTYSSALLGASVADNPTDLAVAFCKETGSAGGSSGLRWWTAAGTSVYQSGTGSGDFDVDDSGSLPVTTGKSEVDIKAFNNKIYLAFDDYLYRRQSATYTEISSSLPSTYKILEVYTDRLYIASDDEITSMNTSEVIATTSNTFDLNSAATENLHITCMRAASNGLWFGTLNRQGGRAKVFFWDGETENTAELAKGVESGMVMAMTIKDDIPYILDNRGVLSKYNGSYFEEVARFDFDWKQLYRFDVNSSLDKWIHHNGMHTVDDEILMVINTRPEDTSDEIPIRHPAGVYAYNEKFGIYHKYSFTAHQDDSNVLDQGHLEVPEVGAMHILFDDEENNDRDDQSDFLVGYAYKEDNGTTRYAIAKEDKRGYDRADTTKAGVLITSFIRAEQVQEQWKRFYTIIKPFENSTDKLVVKYRTQIAEADSVEITWVDTTSFTTTDSAFATIKTNFEANTDYEVEGLSGDGAGYCSHITGITEDTGTYTVTLDETITGMTTNTARVRVDKWNKLGTPFTDDTEKLGLKEFLPDAVSTKIQFKVYMLGSNVELERVLSVSEVAQKT